MSKKLRFPLNIMCLSILIIGSFFNIGCLRNDQIKIVLASDNNKFVSQELLENTLEIISNRVGMFVYWFDFTDLSINKKGQIIVQVPKKNVSKKLLKVLTTTGKLTFQIDKIVMENISFEQIEVYKDSKGYSISFKLKKKDAKKLAIITKNNVNRNLYVYMDDELLMNPVIEEPILDGKGIIKLGDAKKEEIQIFTTLLRTGALPIPLKIIK